MNKILIVLFATFMLASCTKGPRNFKLECNFPNVKGDSAFIMNRDTLIASSAINNGKFTLEGEIDHENFCYLIIKENAPSSKVSKTKIYVEKAEIEISGEFGMYPIYDIKGGEITPKIYAFHKNPEYLKLRRERLSYNKKDRTDEEKVIGSKLASKIRKLDKSRDYTNWPEDHPRHWYHKSYHYFFQKDSARFYEAASILNERFPNHPTCNEINNLKPSMEEYFNKKEVVGTNYHNLVLKNAEGQEVDLSEVLKKNKLVLLDVWASWCGPCRAEFPFLRAAYKKYKEKGFEIYAVSLDKKEKAWLKALEEEKTEWINVVAGDKESNSRVNKVYQIKGIPHNVLINAEGKIIGEKLKGHTLIEVLEKEFN